MILAWSITGAALVALLLAERLQIERLRQVAKPVASIGFLLAAWDADVFASRHGSLIFAGLAASFVGDVLLLGKAKRFLELGLFAFLIAHLLYVGAFFAHGANGAFVGTVIMFLFAPATVVWRWLLPHLGKMKWPVLAYIAAITVMLAAAIGSYRANGGALILLGAVLFYFSDLCVARNRFVREGFINRLIGLPLYYGGQLLLASFGARL